MRKLFRFLLFVCGFIVFSTPPTVARRTTILVSCDGFRWDYTEWYDTPFLDELGSRGVSAELVPSFPSKTFPNHYTLATGLRPEHHGIIANSFLDRKTGVRFSLSDPQTKFSPRFYKGEPIWLTARRQGLRAAVFYWPGADVAVGGKYPDVWHAYNEEPHLTFAQRVDSIVGYLAREDAPDLIMAYFEEPDASGHSHGPHAKETRRAVEGMDSLLASLWARIGETGLRDSVNLVVVSDHGMTWFKPERQIRVSQYINKEWYEAIEGDMPANVYAPQRWQQDSIVRALRDVGHLRVWRKADIPQWLHYRDDANIGDVLVLPDEGFIFSDAQCRTGGMHGYDPAFSDMHALFRACGPDIRQGVALGELGNTAVYPFVCQLLGIQPAPNDGEPVFNGVADKMLRSPRGAYGKQVAH